MTKPYLVAAALGLTTLLGACHDSQSQQASRANFTAAVNDYLAQRGHLCLAKYDWPITVTEADRQMHSPNAQQMPVLETLGLVTGQDAAPAAASPDGAAPARTYTLTPEGQKYYLHGPVVITTANQHLTHPADFCVADLSLDRVIGWEKPLLLDGRNVTSVLFTYKIAPAPWAQTADARRAFPVIARAIDNAGTQQLRLGVHLTRHGWTADELSE